MRHIEELKQLNLPRDKFAIFGSGCLAVRNLRENRDIDIIVKEDLWRKLSENRILNEKGMVEIGNVEISRTIKHLNLEDVDKLIDNAEIINGIRFVRLADLLCWKRKMGREKDIEDIKLIESFLKNGKK